MQLIVKVFLAIVDFFARLFRPISVGPAPTEEDPLEPGPIDQPDDPTPPADPTPITIRKPMIIEDFIPLGRRNRPGYALVPKYITIHDTGNPSRGAHAKAHASYIKSDTAANLPVSWHFTVDDTSVYQHLPLNENGWHAGDGNGFGNRASIGIEICENADGNRVMAEDNAALLVAWLLQEVESLLPFPEALKQHYDWSGKNCPHLIRARPNGWQRFLDSIPIRSNAPGQ